MRILLKTFSTSEDYNADFEYGVVTIEKDYLRTIIARSCHITDILLADQSVDVIEYRDAACVYYGYELEDEDGELPEEIADHFLDYGWAVLPDHLYGQFTEEKSSEADRLNLFVNYDEKVGVYWSAYPRHDTIRITTESLLLDELKQLLEEEEKKASHA